MAITYRYQWSGTFFFYDSFGLFTTGFYNVSDTLYNGTPGFSGSSNGIWNRASIEFPCFAIKKPFELLLRFTFISDSQQSASSTDGWMIDDIVIDNSGFCSSLPENAKIPQLSAIPNPIAETGFIDLGDIYLSGAHMEIYNIQGQLLRTDTQLFGNEIRINRGDLNSGFFTAAIKTDEGKTLAVAKLIFR